MFPSSLGQLCLAQGARLCRRVYPGGILPTRAERRRAIPGVPTVAGTKGKACSRGQGPRAPRVYDHYFPVLHLEDFGCGFRPTKGKGGPFSGRLGLRGVNTPGRGRPGPPEGCTYNPLPFHAEVSSFFLPLLKIATELLVRGSSPLMFILLLSTICVENVHNPLLSLFRRF